MVYFSLLLFLFCRKQKDVVIERLADELNQKEILVKNLKSQLQESESEITRLSSEIAKYKTEIPKLREEIEAQRNKNNVSEMEVVMLGDIIYFKLIPLEG